MRVWLYYIGSKGPFFALNAFGDPIVHTYHPGSEKPATEKSSILARTRQATRVVSSDVSRLNYRMRETLKDLTKKPR